MGLADLTPDQLEQFANTIYSSNKPLNLGPFILGSLVDALLCGILLMQCCSYISLSARDGWLLKITVTYVIAMNLWSTAFAWTWVWELFVRNFGTYRAFLSVKYVSWSSAINAATVFAVQMFFALRAWKILDRNRVFGAVLFILMLISVGSGSAIKVIFTQSYIIYAGVLKVPAYICLCSTVTVDVAITTTILWYLLSRRGVSRRTNHLLNKLTRVTFESQLPPTLIAIAILAVYTVQYDSFILVPLMWLQPKMYGISLLHTLNTRPTMAQPTVAFETTYSAPSYTTSNNGLQPAVAPARTTHTERPNFISYNNAVGASEIRSNFTAPIEPLKPTVVSFDTETVAAISGDSPKVDIILVNSHSVSSDMEMVERESKLTDLESRPSTAG